MCAVEYGAIKWVFTLAFPPFTNDNSLGLGDVFVEGIVLSQVATSTENHILTFAAGAQQVHGQYISKLLSMFSG